MSSNLNRNIEYPPAIVRLRRTQARRAGRTAEQETAEVHSDYFDIQKRLLT